MQGKQSFIDLVSELYTENRESSLNRLVNELKSGRGLVALLADESDLNEDDDLRTKEFINLLINLPHITGNIFQLLNDPLFIPEKYFNVLCSILYDSLKQVHEKLKHGRNQNLSLIAHLIGQICFNKFEQIYWSRVGRRVLECSKDDLIWRKIGRRLIKQQNPLYLENLIRLLLLNAQDGQQVEWYLDSNDSPTIKHLLTNKFLLINHFAVEKQNLVDNIIGYLISSNIDLFKDTLRNVIAVWSNATLVRHQTNDQHFYLCRILICCLKHMIRLNHTLDADLRPLILHSAETHLKMVELEKRNRGLFVVEKLINYLNDSEVKLDFEIDSKTDEIEFLIKILEEKTENKVQESEETKDELKCETNELDDQVNGQANEETEDDLIPYDMSNDTPLKGKKPIYLKDCFEGLLNTEDLEFNSTCLQCLSDLIDKNRSQASELAVDFVRVLLFLENEELKECRSKTMIKLCTLNPMSTAQYLTDQVYDQNVTITRRLEILDVIVESAREFSSLEHHIEETKIKSIQNIVRHEKAEYEKIIEERLKSKTRILCSSHKVPLSSKNEFLPFVGHFFYPLINNFDRKDITLRFNEDDYFVLGKLMITLAELLKSVSQTHVTRKMAIAFIEFLNTFRYHQEPYVRKAITSCIHSILTNVPNYFLFEDLQAELLTLRDYLLALKQLDPETFHGHGVLTLFTLEEQINDYQNKIKTNEKMKKIQLSSSS